MNLVDIGGEICKFCGNRGEMQYASLTKGVMDTPANLN